MNTAVYAAVVALLLIPGQVYAQEGVGVSAGVTPDSPLWALDIALEKLELMLTFDKTEKIRKRIEFAEERFAEAQKMIEENKTEAAVKALKMQVTHISKAKVEAREIRGEGASANISAMIQQHFTHVKREQKKMLDALPAPARRDAEKMLEQMGADSTSTDTERPVAEDNHSEDTNRSIGTYTVYFKAKRVDGCVVLRDGKKILVVDEKSCPPGSRYTEWVPSCDIGAAVREIREIVGKDVTYKEIQHSRPSVTVRGITDEQAEQIRSLSCVAGVEKEAPLKPLSAIGRLLGR